jgi:hypothetical protein
MYDEKPKNDFSRWDILPGWQKVLVALIAGLFGCFGVTFAFDLGAEVSTVFTGDLAPLIERLAGNAVDENALRTQIAMEYQQTELAVTQTALAATQTAMTQWTATPLSTSTSISLTETNTATATQQPTETPTFTNTPTHTQSVTSTATSTTTNTATVTQQLTETDIPIVSTSQPVTKVISANSNPSIASDLNQLGYNCGKSGIYRITIIDGAYTTYSNITSWHNYLRIFEGSVEWEPAGIVRVSENTPATLDRDIEVEIPSSSNSYELGYWAYESDGVTPIRTTATQAANLGIGQYADVPCTEGEVLYMVPVGIVPANANSDAERDVFYGIHQGSVEIEIEYVP